MKKAIVLDVDGVIIGEKKGINTPHPHQDVLNKLKQVRESGIPIILCTAKPAFAISYEIENANLDNPHIADGGALLVDNHGKVYEQFSLEKNLAKQIVKTLIDNNIYTEVYTSSDYIIEKSQVSDITDKHAFVLQRKPVIVESLEKFCDENVITKIIFVVADESFKSFGEKVFEPFKNNSTMVWAVHPPILPLQFGIITSLGISKPKGLEDIAKILGTNLENMLAVGDSTSDWKFMKLCGYVGAMGNATSELKELSKSKGNGKFMIGKTVDENGVIDIIDWFEKV